MVNANTCEGKVNLFSKTIVIEREIVWSVRVFIVQLFVLYFLEPRLPIGAFIFVNIEAYLCYLVIVVNCSYLYLFKMPGANCSIFGCGTSRKHKGYRINIFIKSNSFLNYRINIFIKSNSFLNYRINIFIKSNSFLNYLINIFIKSNSFLNYRIKFAINRINIFCINKK